MSEPLVCAVMLVNGRPDMVHRAVASFRAQTYGNKRLLIFETSEQPCVIEWFPQAMYFYRPEWRRTVNASIGKLRNVANSLSKADVLCTWDSDDASHPQRIAEQVALLQSSGADVVGYNEMLFWDERPPQYTQIRHVEDIATTGRAWLYSRTRSTYAVGTSLAYWRRSWKRYPFPDLPQPGNPNSIAEDTVWLNSGMKVLGVSSMQDEPRMIASIHGNNTQSYEGVGRAPEFKRVAQWDEYCARQMRLEVMA